MEVLPSIIRFGAKAVFGPLFFPPDTTTQLLKLEGQTFIILNIDRRTESLAMTEAPMLFTESAANKVRDLILADGNPELKLRVYITGGGCSGFQYGFTFDEAADEDDIQVQRDGMTLLVDPLSFQYLEGSEVDYTENLQGARFVIRNPNAATTCGCGSSFGVA